MKENSQRRYKSTPNDSLPIKNNVSIFFSRIRKKRRKEKNRKSLTGYWLMGGETREVKVCEMKQKKNI